MQKTYSVLSTLSATQANNADLVNGELIITGCPTIKFDGLKCDGIHATVAETLGVVTITPNAANSTDYQFILRQYDIIKGTWIQHVIQYTSLASGDTATTICNAFRSQIARFIDFQVTLNADGNATCIITAKAGYPLITGTKVTASITSVTQTTPGVKAVNTYAVLTAEGVAGLTTGKTYSSWQFDHDITNPSINGAKQVETKRHILYVQDDATNYAGFATQMTYVLGATFDATGAADPEAVAVA